MDTLVYKHNPELKDESDCAKVIIPEKYRICGTCFTAFTLVGDSSDGWWLVCSYSHSKIFQVQLRNEKYLV